MTKEQLISRVQGCFLGVALGDALGLPWETKSREEIINENDGPVTSFPKAACTSDDTQLTLAVARSLVDWGSFDVVHQASAHLDEFRQSTDTWGSTTKESMVGLNRWFQNGRIGPLPEPARIPGKGAGNGVAMKIAPLAVFHALTENWRLMENVHELGRLTHPDHRASGAAFTLALAAAATLRRGKRAFLEDREALIALIEKHTRLWELSYGRHADTSDLLSERFRRAASLIYTKATPNVLAETIGTSCNALESVPFSIALFFRNSENARDLMLSAVNAGGDTDSNASMVGALVGAHLGIEAFPPEWRGILAEEEELLTLGANFVHKFSR